MLTYILHFLNLLRQCQNSTSTADMLLLCQHLPGCSLLLHSWPSHGTPTYSHLRNPSPSSHSSFLFSYLDYWKPGRQRMRLAALAAWSRYWAWAHSSGRLHSLQQEAPWTVPPRGCPSGPLCSSSSSCLAWESSLGKLKALIPGRNRIKLTGKNGGGLFTILEIPSSPWALQRPYPLALPKTAWSHEQRVTGSWHLHHI